jgi:hypothetical protein
VVEVIRILKKINSRLLLVTIGLTNLFMYNNCFVRRPELTNRNIASASYFHSGTETSCNSCHSGSRPLIAVGPSYTFDHVSTLYGGQNDCITCHASQTTWAGGQFDHSPQPTSCSNCHQAQRPTTLVGTPSFDHNTNGQSDCYACHAASTTNYTVMTDWAGASGVPSSLIGNTTLSANVGTPVWTNTTMTSVTGSIKTFPLQMLHNSNQIPSSLMIPAIGCTINCTPSCAACHTTSANGNYTNGLYHSKIVAAGGSIPTACISCHVNSVPVGFVGAAGAFRTPASSEMRHDAVVWNSDAAGFWSASTTKIVTQECTVCHASVVPGTVGSWATPGASFHAKLNAATIAQPTSCLDCHANNRPTGVTGPTNFIHSSSGGMGDCYACHALGVTSNSFTSWTNTGSYSHAGRTSCTACHATERPANTTAWVQAPVMTASTSTFNTSTHATGTDCYTCHSASIVNNVFTSMANWQGGNYTHSPAPTTCANCHSYPTATTPTLTGSGLTYMDHSGFGGQECSGCHASPPNFISISGWGGASATPAGLVSGTGSVWNNWTMSVGTLNYGSGAISTATVTATTVNLPQQMLHSSAQVPAGIKNTCSTCHTVGLNATSGTQFHPHVPAAQIAACTECHSTAATPNGIVGPLGTVSATNQPNMHHYATYTGGATIVAAQDCVACHKNTVGTSWKDGVFHANKGANTLNSCFACHIKRMPVGIINSGLVTDSYKVNHFSHQTKYITMDCIACHSSASVGPTGSWVATGRIHTAIAAGTFTECKSCHNTTPSPDTPFKHTRGGHKGYDCKTCHTPGTTWNLSVVPTAKNCNMCH